MNVRHRSYVDLIPVFLCVLILGVGGFFIAINTISLPGHAQVSTIEPTLPSSLDTIPDTTSDNTNVVEQPQTPDENPTLTPTTPPITTPTLTTQHIETPMQGVSILQYSYMNYTNYLQAGDVIDGVVQLTGPSHDTDNSYQWTFQILGPGVESIKVLTGDFRTTSSLQFHVPVSYAGTYRIRVTHQSISTKTLAMDLTPSGWGYADLK